MLDQEFDVENIASVDFGVAVRDGGRFFVPVDGGVQDVLKQMVQATARAFDHIEGDWEEFSVSEDYGADRRIFVTRANELMVDLSAMYEMGDLPDMANLPDVVTSIESYFAVLRDNQARKIVAVKKATQFKGTLGARNRLVRIADNSLQLIRDNVLKLDLEFDAIIADRRIYIRKALPVEYLANIVDRVAGAAAEKVRYIEDNIPFLDLSGLAGKIEKHPGTARLAASIAARDDLNQTQRPYVEQMAAAQGVRFVRTNDGRLKPRAGHEHKLLEILDNRRFLSGLIGGAPVPFRARARQRVIVDL